MSRPHTFCLVVNGSPRRQLCGCLSLLWLVLARTCLPPLVVKVVGCVLVPHGRLVVLASCLRCLARSPFRNLVQDLEAVDALFPKQRAHSSSRSVTLLLVAWSYPPLGRPRQGITQPTQGALAHSYPNTDATHDAYALCGPTPAVRLNPAASSSWPLHALPHQT